LKTPRRWRRSGEAGSTLIELIVTMALMAISFLAVLGAFSVIEVTVGATSNDALLASQAREVEDYVQSESFAYVQCEPASGSDYDAALGGAISSGKIPWSSTYTAHVVAVAQASGGSHNGVPTLTPINGCVPPTGVDYGVQQIKIQVRTPQFGLNRIVYKRWN
jgi:type II secretory pathway pseudopilin PulG